ncbi:MAG TPA: type II secretion system F family protein [Candidatus Hydrogenedens sp.]|nr:type II secretion system F family protein [Candidatus Hydrogenedens sp.]HOL20471.1 type II secretion system F family protein [Candidatus Hydrogenedens sp.]
MSFGKFILNYKMMSILCRQLASAYEGGIPIIQALQIVGDGFPSRRVKLILYHCADDLIHGKTLSDALKQREVFPDLFIQLVSAGERSGRLDVILRDLSVYYEDLWKMKRSTLASLTYPIIQLILGWFLGTFALGIVKQISFERSFSLDAYFTSYISFQIKVCILFFLFFMVVMYFKNTKYFQNVIYSIFRYVWPFSFIIHKFSLTRFFKSFALLYASGIPITDALLQSSELLPSSQYQQDVIMAVHLIRNGSTLEKAFKSLPWVGRLGQEMVAVGEQSGKLDESLQKVAEYFLSDAQQALRVASKVFNILILLLVGAVIGFIVISFYARLYGNMLNQLGI